MNMKSILAVLIGLLVSFGGLWAGDAAAEAKPGQFLGILRLTERYQAEANWDEAAKAAVGRHFNRLKELAKTGRVILAGRTREPNDQTMGLVIFEAQDRADAERFMADDPAVQARIMRAEVRPYQVAVIRD